MERSSKADLLKILLKLQNDLMQKKTGAVMKYTMTSHGVNVTNPTSEFG